jgi:aspartate/methionine/tyrosine aminotransferase
MPQTAFRLCSFTESVIREMTRISDKYNAINLSQGFPDFDPPHQLITAACRALSEGYHQYAITWGSQRFRKALAKKQQYWMRTQIDPDANIVVTCGATEAMMVAMMTACNPGDKVIIFSPFYENYGADTILCGAEPIYVSLYPPTFEFDPEELRKAFQKGVKALIICNPSNPTGKVFNFDELQLIAELACEYDVFVITDEVYEHIVYEPNIHRYMASFPDMYERTISCSSLSKTYSITGWRLGYVIACEKIINAAKKVHDFLTVGAAAPLQEAAVAALELPLDYYTTLRKEYTQRRDLFLNYLDRANLRYTIPQGAYYVLVDISEFGFINDTQFCRWMAKEVGVAAVPGSSFFNEPVKHLVRFHFAKKEETLKAAGEKLLKLSSLV